MDSKGQGLGSSCNSYIDGLYAACPNLDEVRVAGGSDCVSLGVFERPLICQTADDCAEAVSYSGYTPHEFKSDLGTFKVEGFLAADTIVLFLQGGPSDELEDSYAQFLEGDTLVAYVAQTGFLKPDLLYSYDISLDEAYQEQAENLEIAHRAETALRRAFPEKRIVLAGHSMGAFLSLGYLAKYGNKFDAVVVMAGRVDTPLDFARRFALGQDLQYEAQKDLDDDVSDQQEQEKPVPFESYLRFEYRPFADNVMLAAIGLPRYSKLLEGVDLSNMLYLYSSRDEKVGGLSSGEIAFLETHGATVEDVGWDPENMGHSRMLGEFEYLDRITQFVVSHDSASTDP